MNLQNTVYNRIKCNKCQKAFGTVPDRYSLPPQSFCMDCTLEMESIRWDNKLEDKMANIVRGMESMKSLKAD